MRFAVLAALTASILLAGCATATVPAPGCPTGLTAELLADGSVALAWDAVPGADGYNLYGPSWDGPMLFIGHVTTTTAQPGAPPPDMPMAYSVKATMGELESLSCPVVDVTPIPVFPSALALALGATGAFLGVLVALRKR